MDTWSILLVSIARWILGSALLLAALTKWFDLSSFQRVIMLWRVGRPEWSAIIARGVPGLETFIGIALLLNVYPKITAALSVGLLIIFTSLLTVRLVKGETEGCGCFGNSQNEKINSITIVRNFLLLSLSLYILFAPEESWNPLPIPLTLVIGILILARIRVPSDYANHGLVQTQVSSAPDYLSRRSFLKLGLGILGAMLLDTLGIKPAYALSCSPPPRCCCTQTYHHNESSCGTFGCSQFQRRHHKWTRHVNRVIVVVGQVAELLGEMAFTHVSCVTMHVTQLHLTAGARVPIAILAYAIQVRGRF
jgi:uncharacterized membrane protein YphA (DoxX/SURF4 family)